MDKITVHYICGSCGHGFTREKQSGRKPEFCSKECRSVGPTPAGRKAQGAFPIQEIPQRRACLRCGSEFLTVENTHVYCGGRSTCLRLTPGEREAVLLRGEG